MNCNNGKYFIAKLGIAQHFRVYQEKITTLVVPTILFKTVFPILQKGFAHRSVWKWRSHVYPFLANSESFAATEGNLQIWTHEGELLMLLAPLFPSFFYFHDFCMTLQCLEACKPLSSNTASHDNHEKINAWLSLSFLHGYGAPLGGPWGRRSSTIKAIEHKFLRVIGW